MAHTDALQQFMDQLRTDTALQDQLRNQPSQAVSGRALTAHERDALMTLDADDFVATGFAPSVYHLPPPLRPQPSIQIDELAELREHINKLLEKHPGFGRLPQPGPFPPGPFADLRPVEVLPARLDLAPRPEPDLPPLSAAPKPTRRAKASIAGREPRADEPGAEAAARAAGSQLGR